MGSSTNPVAQLKLPSPTVFRINVLHLLLYDLQATHTKTQITKVYHFRDIYYDESEKTKIQEQHNSSAHL